MSLEQEQDQRYEYFAGEVFAMAGGTFNHALISSNGLTTLTNSLRDYPCQVLGSDMKLYIATWDKFCYPDIQVLCTESSQDRIHAELFTCGDNEQWLFNESKGMDASIHLPYLKIYLYLAELYRNVDLG